MRHLYLLLPLAAGALSAFGCSTSSGEAAETAGSALDSDMTLARAAVTAIAGTNARCNTCHTAGKDEIVRWGTAMKVIEETCLSSSLTLTPAEKVACLRSAGDEAEPQYSASKLGLYSAAAALPELEDVFKAAFPDDAQAQYDAFKEQAGMPAFGAPGLSAAEFAKVKEWVLRGMPQLDAVMSEPGAIRCVPKTTPELASHMERLKQEGWGARLAEASTPMANCGSATNAAECLKGFDDVTAELGPESTGQTLRLVRRLDFRTSFWVRSSADGRFTAFGGSPSRIIDNDAPATTPPITADAPYDPGFFPNNDGFSYAGTRPGGLRVCKQSVLLNAANGTTPATRKITFTEAGCTQIINTVYQSVGAALDGSLFFMATGAHTNDAGGASGPLSASFGENAMTTMTPMFNDGTKYVKGAAVQVKIPHEGDQQMSPSNTLLITRFGQKAGFSGYRIRTVTPTITPSTTPGGTPSVSVDMKEIGTICLQGGKPQMSFDERFVAVHQFTDANANPAGFPAGTANIFMVDLKTGTQFQVTNMKAGQKALFPHWRADGWLYFLVKDANTGKESLVASDIALRQN
jgi:hypothetical protein